MICSIARLFSISCIIFCASIYPSFGQGNIIGQTGVIFLDPSTKTPEFGFIRVFTDTSKKVVFLRMGTSETSSAIVPLVSIGKIDSLANIISDCLKRIHFAQKEQQMEKVGSIENPVFGQYNISGIFVVFSNTGEVDSTDTPISYASIEILDVFKAAHVEHGYMPEKQLTSLLTYLKIASAMLSSIRNRQNPSGQIENATQKPSNRTYLKSIDVPSFLVDFDSYEGKLVKLDGYMLAMGETIILYEHEGSMNYIFLNISGLSSEEQKRILRSCGNGCNAVLLGKPTYILYQKGLYVTQISE